MQVLHVERTTEEDEDGDTIVDYTADHPCFTFLLWDFPALYSLTVMEATPADIFDILSRISATTRPGIRQLTLQCAPGSGAPTFESTKQSGGVSCQDCLIWRT